MSTIVTRAGKGAALTWTEGDANITNLNNDKMEAVIDDTNPKLGGNLDVDGKTILGGSYGGNQVILPVGGGTTIKSLYEGGVNFLASNDGGTTSKSWKLNIDGTTDFPAFKFPATDGTSNQVLKTDGAGVITWTTVSSGATTLDGLTDVNTSGAMNNHVLKYNSTATEWQSSLLDIPTTLDSLTDVSSSGATNGQVLAYNSGTSSWQATTVSSGGISNVVEDTTPSLGGDLDMVDFKIKSTGTSGIMLIQPATTNDEVRITGQFLSIGNPLGSSAIANVGTIAAQSVQLAPEAGAYSYIRVNRNANGNILIAPDGTGKVVIDNLSWPTADGTANQVLKTDGAGNLGWVTAGGAPQYAIIRCDALNEFTSTFAETTLTQTFVEVLDANSLVTVTTTSFTISNAGTYLIEYVGNRQLTMFTSNSSANLNLPALTVKFKNTTDNTVVYQNEFGALRVYGTASGQSGNNNIGQNNFSVVVTTAAAKTFGFTASITAGSGYNSFSVYLGGTPKPQIIITKLA